MYNSMHVSFRSIRIPFHFLFVFKRDLLVFTQNWPNHFDWNQSKRIEMILHICSIVVRNSMSDQGKWRTCVCGFSKKQKKKKGFGKCGQSRHNKQITKWMSPSPIVSCLLPSPALTEINVWIEFWDILWYKWK